MMDQDSFELYGQDQYYGSSDDDFEEQMPIQQILSLPNMRAEQSEVKPKLQQALQKQVQKQIQKETPSQIFQFNEENVACKICYKYAINAVLCKNQKCGILFCGSCAVDSIKRIDNRCPFCRVSPFQYKQSPFKTIINKMQLVCQLCQQKYALQEEQTHYKKKCQYFFKITCEYCNQSMQQNQIVKHTRIKHEDKLDEIIEKMYTNPRPIFEPKQLLAKEKFYLSKINKTPHLGTTGKFYCGGRLQGPKCSCCNGYCGPTNGENCAQCMKLDIKRLGLSKGYLVNSNGNVCWRKGEQFICGTMIYYQNSNCKEGQTCRACRNMRTNIKRYIDLL